MCTVIPYKDSVRVFKFIYVYECFVYVYVCAPCSCLVRAKARRGVEHPGTAVTDSCELPCGCREFEPRSSGRAAVLLAAELSLAPVGVYLIH